MEFFLLRKHNYRALSEIKRNITIKNTDVIHIIGSGSSLLKSVNEINKGEHILGFNFSGLIGLEFDYYFIESGSYTSIPNQGMLKVINVLSKKKKIKNVFLKNMWEGKININELSKKMFLPYITLSDYSIQQKIKGFIQLKTAQKVKILFNSKRYLRQYNNSIISMLVFSYQIGYKKIYVHGYDGGGEHFFNTDSFNTSDFFDDDFKEQLKKHYQSKQKQYVQMGILKRDILYEIITYLQSKGVNLIDLSRQN